MIRDRKVIAIAHCILNQNVVVHPLARAKGAFNDVVKIILDYDFGILQLPCPETTFAGMNRPPMSYDEYDTPLYQHCCQSLAKDVFFQCSLQQEDHVQIAGIIGIQDSPSCSNQPTGHFMEALAPLRVPRFDITTDYVETNNMEQKKQMLDELALFLAKL